MLNIAKEDILLKRKLISQFEKSDEELSASISKISKTMECSGSAMQQCVGIMGGLMMQHFSLYISCIFFVYSSPIFMSNQNIQSNANNVRSFNKSILGLCYKEVLLYE